MYFISHLGIDFAGIFAGDDLLNSGWDQNVAWLVHEVLALVLAGARESHNRAALVAVIFQCLQQTHSIKFQFKTTE